MGIGHWALGIGQKLGLKVQLPTSKAQRSASKAQRSGLKSQLTYSKPQPPRSKVQALGPMPHTPCPNPDKSATLENFLQKSGQT